MRFKFKYHRPTRTQLGMGRAAFKTLLEKRGYKFRREFFGKGCSIAYRNGRRYRFRWWNEDGFVVDISCVEAAFDRWANSVDQVLTVEDWLKILVDFCVNNRDNYPIDKHTGE